MKKLLFCVVTLIVVLSIISCEKDIQEDQSIKLNPQQRAMGLIEMPLEKYNKFINHEKIKAHLTSKVALSTSVDLTSFFPNPGDQGFQGSCVSWAVAYSAKSYYENQELGWQLNTNNHLFSPQFIYSQVHADNSSGGGGSTFASALDLVVNQGVSSLDVTPYDAYNPYGFNVQPTEAMRQNAARYKNMSWNALPLRNITVIKEMLSNKTPVLMGIPVYPDFDNLNSSNNIYDDLNGALRGRHAITLIGYDDDKQAFKFVNQWGTSWGLAGYGWISYNLIENNDFEVYVMYDDKNSAFEYTWGSTSTAGISSLGYYSGDFNGDGSTDVIQPWSNNGKLGIIVHNISSGNSSIICNTTFTAGSGSVGFVPADMNGDGKTDMIQGWNSGGKLALSVFLSNGSTFYNSWNTTTPNGSGNLRLLPVDIDGDGKIDIVQLWSNNGKLAMTTYKSTGSSYYVSNSITLSGGSGNVGFMPADVDGDGKTDIVQCWDDNGSMSVSVFKSTGASYYNSWNGKMPQGSSNVGLLPTDYNNDGKMDFVQGWNNNGNLNLLLYKSDGEGYTFVSNTATTLGSGNLALLPIKSLLNNTKIIQVWSNNVKTAFIGYDNIVY